MDAAIQPELPYMPAPIIVIDPIEAKLIEWCELNPTIYPMFVERALSAIKAGHRRYSSKTIIEVIRWHFLVQTKGDAFKINNNASAIFSRWFHRDHPEHDGFFITRKRASE